MGEFITGTLETKEMQEFVGQPVAEVPNGRIFAIRDGYRIEAHRKVSRRIHRFHDIPSFAGWLLRFADPRETEILAGEQVIDAALDATDADGDVVRCNLVHHPAFAAWMRAFNGKRDQRSLAAFVRGNLGTFPDGSGDFLAAELRKLSVGKDQQIDAELDERGFYRMRSSSGNIQLKGQIPASFEINTPIFMGVQDEHGVERRYRLEILLAIDMDGDGDPAFSLSCPELPLAMHQARIDAVDHLRRLLNEDWLVGLGELGLQEVEVGFTAGWESESEKSQEK